MRDLNHDFKELCRHNRDGSYATRVDREHILDLVADQLHERAAKPLPRAFPRASVSRTGRREAGPGHPAPVRRGTKLDPATKKIELELA